MDEAHKHRVIIVSNRLPVTVKVQDGKLVVKRSVGGLATGLRVPHEDSHGIWIGWSGMTDALDPAGQKELDEKLSALRTLALPLDKDEVETFYETVSNGVLWPVCHDRVDQLPLHVEGWDVYESVNAKYADAIAEQHRPGDVIWVHDYQLLRVPALLRERLPDARIGFFLHVPFPGPEIFGALPPRKWLIEGMMGADVIGFHTHEYVDHFRESLRRLFGLDVGAEGTVSWQGRQVRLDAFPMGIDVESFAERSQAPEVMDKVREYCGGPGNRLLLGVDRLDYSKGIPRRLLAMERFLEQHEEWRGRVRLIQVAVPSRDQLGTYKETRAEVEKLVGRINGRFGTPTWTPCHYLYRSVSRDTLLALYRAADVMLVTPLRDGMNLVAKEFVAARSDENGVLVLSELAGAAETMTEAVIVNPYDVDGMADAIHQALEMDETERGRRMRALRADVQEHDVHHWTHSFLEVLEHDAATAA